MTTKTELLALADRLAPFMKVNGVTPTYLCCAPVGTIEFVERELRALAAHADAEPRPCGEVTDEMVHRAVIAYCKYTGFHAHMDMPEGMRAALQAAITAPKEPTP